VTLDANTQRSTEIHDLFIGHSKFSRQFIDADIARHGDSKSFDRKWPKQPMPDVIAEAALFTRFMPRNRHLLLTDFLLNQ